MKIVTVVGARPQFIKAAVVSRQLRKHTNEILVHTGQHYDYNMSDIFFEQLNIPHPDYNLGISRGTHGQMTGRMIEAIEDVLLNEKPDKVLVYGDTNSTLAAALAAVKLHIPVNHVEAGNRLNNLDNPEEVNRICTDHVSNKLFACTKSAMDFLDREGLSDKAFLVGDPMYDAFSFYSKIAPGIEGIGLVDLEGKKTSVPVCYYYMTCHRQENTDTDEKLDSILSAMESLDAPTIYPVHPRNGQRAKYICEKNNYHNIILTKPVGYLESIALVSHAKKIITDSGGLQREAFFAGKQCVTVFDNVIWPETMVGNRNQLAKPDKEDIIEKLIKKQILDSDYLPFGDGHSAERICSEIIK
ncbi:non-hydrolyzing UDP-N-acetylglucosamine 2-epimerase [Ruminococcus sp.]|uniref:non-hydrolyzing UDP-N-acetylglucosamine 2-epimerase n=1 Tax=Ruminococcus sp. TaxID=41978 RepID=UPI002E782CE6|nr:UDP-N-acetylglucosamine 2-epimerase (non-hydrolyzing) [Ruminococcus sp.]MEE1262779.1 UDP-N-acetylglucosamine 2-epimerase (non-hydrolyzing) [Ruminococcus sp.]